MLFFFQAEDGIRYAQESRGLGDVYKRQRLSCRPITPDAALEHVHDDRARHAREGVVRPSANTLHRGEGRRHDGGITRGRGRVSNRPRETEQIMTNIAIIGGHGKVALRLAPLLVEAGDEVTSWIRSQDQVEDIEQTGACLLYTSPSPRDS